MVEERERERAASFPRQQKHLQKYGGDTTPCSFVQNFVDILLSRAFLDVYKHMQNL